MPVLTEPAASEKARSVIPAPAEFRSVSKTYKSYFGRRIEAVRDVSLRIEAGEAFGLVGPNRAGKTTLVKMLLSLCAPTSGTVLRFGQPSSVRETLAAVGYVHENHAFPRYLGAAALLEYYGALTFLRAEVLRERVPQLLERFGLADRAHEPIARFSKGMLQRLGMAQALLADPRLLVLDEPTEGLDLAGRHLLRDVIGAVKKAGGSVVLITHVLTEIEHLCDRVGVLVQGRLTHVGPAADLVTDPCNGKRRSLERTLQELYAKGGR